MRGLVLAKPTLSWRHLLQTDAFGGRAPRALTPFLPVATTLEAMPGRDWRHVWSCPECGQYVRRMDPDPPDDLLIQHLPFCPLWSLVLHDDDTLVGRRGLVTATRAVDSRGWGFRLTAEYGVVYLDLLDVSGAVIRRFRSDDLPWLSDNRAEIRCVLFDDPPRADDGLLAEAVAACLLRLGVVSMWVSDRKRRVT